MRVPQGYHEDPDAARARHYAARPEDRDADVVIYPRLGAGLWGGGGPGGGMSGLNRLGTPVPVIAPSFRGAF